MKLSAPKMWTWIIAVIIAALGIAGLIFDIPLVTDNGFWVEFIAFLLLAIGTLFKGI